MHNRHAPNELEVEPWPWKKNVLALVRRSRNDELASNSSSAGFQGLLDRRGSVRTAHFLLQC